MPNHILQKLQNTIPSTFSPESNQIILALLKAVAQNDEFLETQAKNAKDQAFIQTADGVGLDALANSVGVIRPLNIGLIDDDFRRLIPLLSLTPKLVKKAFYDVGEVFFGPYFIYPNNTTSNTAPFNLNLGDELIIKVDNGPPQSITIRAGDVVAPGLATTQEVLTWMERLNGVTASAITDPGSGNQQINLRTDTPGSVGGLEIVSSSAIGVGKLEFAIGRSNILDLAQRFNIYNLSPNELIIEIPAAIPTLRRTLLGSHHFHTDETLHAPVPTENGIWQGSFLHDPSGSQGGFTITSQVAVLQSPILAGDVLTTINVADTSLFQNPTGQLIFDFGRTEQEFSVQYIGILNANTIAIDPAYVFQENHPTGRNVHALASETPITPRKNGFDYSIYLPSPVAARIIVQEILEKLKAAGIILKFVPQIPEYRYRCDNPFTSEDDAPGI